MQSIANFGETSGSSCRRRPSTVLARIPPGSIGVARWVDRPENLDVSVVERPVPTGSEEAAAATVAVTAGTDVTGTVAAKSQTNTAGTAATASAGPWLLALRRARRRTRDLGQTVTVSTVSVRVPACWEVGPETVTGAGTGPITTAAVAEGDGYNIFVEAFGTALSFDDFVANTTSDPVVASAKMTTANVGSRRAFSITQQQDGTNRYTRQLWIETPVDGVVRVAGISKDSAGQLVDAIFDTLIVQLGPGRTPTRAFND